MPFQIAEAKRDKKLRAQARARHVLDIELGAHIINFSERRDAQEGEAGGEAGLFANLSLAIQAQKSLYKLQLPRMRLSSDGSALIAPAINGLGSIQELDLADNDLRSAGLGHFAKYLGSLTGLEALDITNNGVGTKGARSLATALRACTRLTGLRLARNNLGDEGIEAITATLNHAQKDSKERTIVWPVAMNMTELDVAHNGIGPAGCERLCGLMKRHCERMVRLSLEGNSLTLGGSEFQGVHALGKALMTMTKLEYLNLAGCHLAAEGGQAVVNGLLEKERFLKREVQKAWKEVGVANDLTPKERIELEEQAMAKEKAAMFYVANRILKTLLLNNNSLSIEGMGIIGEARGIFRGLRHIEIGSNDLTGNSYNQMADGAMGMTNSLRAAKLVTHLDVSDNGLNVGNDGAVLNMVCQALFGLSQIVFLNLASNVIGVKGSRMLAGALNALKHIQHLDLRSNNIQSEGLKTIVPAMRSSLKLLNLANNDIGPDGVSALTVALQGLTCLTYIDLSSNHLMHAFSRGGGGGGDDSLDEDGPVGGAGLLMKAFGGGGGGVCVEKRGGKIGAARVQGLLKEVAGKMMIAGGELRKLALMGADDNSGVIKRGFPLFAHSIAQHLSDIKTIVVGTSVAAGVFRQEGPRLDFASSRLGCEELVIIGELLKMNTRLTSLSLKGNDMTWRGGDLVACDSIAGWIAEATNLRHLDLTKVNLGDWGMVRIAKGLAANSAIEELRLGENFFGAAGAYALAQGIVGMSQLRVLDLHGNPLSKIDARDPLYQVQGTHQGVICLAQALAESCTSIEVLDVRGCSLEDAEGTAMAALLGRCEGLLEVFLGSNELGDEAQMSVAKALVACPHVKMTDSISAPVAKKSDAGKCLTEWDLHGRISLLYQMSFVSNCVLREQFRVLDFSGNALGKSDALFVGLCKALKCLDCLDTLNLSSNAPFTHRTAETLAMSLRSMTSLLELRLSQNGIHGEGADAIACALVCLTCLQHLDISQNRFTTLPVGLAHACSKLTRLNAQWNPWSFPSPEIMAKNTFLIKEHMYSLHVKGQLNRELTLVFIGGQESGKTSAVRAMVASDDNVLPPLLPWETTRGVAFSEWKAGARSDDLDCPLFSVWDFGGASVYRGFQEEMLLPRRALYCITWRPHRPLDTSTPDFSNRFPGADPSLGPLYRVRRRGLLTRGGLEECLREQIVPWMDMLWKKVSGGRVVLLATHADEMRGGCGGEEMVWQSSVVARLVEDASASLAEKYPYLPPLVVGSKGRHGCSPGGWHVSSKTGEGIEVLRRGLVKTAISLPFYGELLPTNWSRVREEMRRESARARRVVNERGAYSVGGRSMVADERNAAAKRDDTGDDEASLASVGYAWLGHFKRLVKQCGVDDTQCIPLLRLFHDAGWLRCFMFDEAAGSRVQGNDTFGGLTCLDVYRTTQHKIATNSPILAFNKGSPPMGTRPKCWVNALDTVFTDMSWLVAVVCEITTHDGFAVMKPFEDDVGMHAQARNLVRNGLLVWSPGSPSLLRHLWGGLMPGTDFRRVRNVLEVKNVLVYRTKTMAQVQAMIKREGPLAVPPPHAQHRATGGAMHRKLGESAPAPPPGRMTYVSYDKSKVTKAPSREVNALRAMVRLLRVVLEDLCGMPGLEEPPKTHGGGSAPAPAKRRVSLSPPQAEAHPGEPDHAPAAPSSSSSSSQQQQGDAAVTPPHEGGAYSPAPPNDPDGSAASLVDSDAGSKREVVQVPGDDEASATSGGGGIAAVSSTPGRGFVGHQIDESTKAKIDQCGLFVCMLTSSYMRSYSCKMELSYALEVGLDILPIILPDYTSWPPVKRASHWWEAQDEWPFLSYLINTDPIDCARDDFALLFDAVGEPDWEPHEFPANSNGGGILRESMRSRRSSIISSASRESRTPKMAEMTSPRGRAMMALDLKRQVSMKIVGSAQCRPSCISPLSSLARCLGPFCADAVACGVACRRGRRPARLTWWIWKASSPP